MKDKNEKKSNERRADNEQLIWVYHNGKVSMVSEEALATDLADMYPEAIYFFVGVREP